MSFSYTAGNSSNLNRLRLNIQDVDSTNYFFQDEELNDILAQVDNDLNQAIVKCFLIIAGSKSKLAKYKRAGNYSEDLGSLAKDLREQAKTIQEMGSVPYETIAEQTFIRSDEIDFIDRESIRGDI